MLTAHSNGAAMPHIFYRAHGIPYFSGYTDGYKARQFGQTRHMPHGTCHMLARVANFAPTGAMIFPSSLTLPHCWIRRHQSVWGLGPGGGGGLWRFQLYVNSVTG